MKEAGDIFRGPIEKPNPIYGLDSSFPIIMDKKFSKVVEEIKSLQKEPMILHITGANSEESGVKKDIHSLYTNNPNFIYITHNGNVPKNIKIPNFDLVLVEEDLESNDSYGKIDFGYKLLEVGGYLYGYDLLVDHSLLENFLNYLENGKNGFSSKFSEKHSFPNLALKKQGFCNMNCAFHKEESDDSIPPRFKSMLLMSEKKYADSISHSL